MRDRGDEQSWCEERAWGGQLGQGQCLQSCQRYPGAIMPQDFNMHTLKLKDKATYRSCSHGCNNAKY